MPPRPRPAAQLPVLAGTPTEGVLRRPQGQLQAARAWRQSLPAHTKRATRGLEERFAGWKSEETVVLVGIFRVSYGATEASMGLATICIVRSMLLCI